ncbi:MAG TPA: D-alanyl-D-alanine carboxypeptidase family protein [Chloroflexia bacterium]|nr:D-alanyl-D-alanine carboxypeptidase family protein [Chloroflexia bacterium]
MAAISRKHRTTRTAIVSLLLLVLTLSWSGISAAAPATQEALAEPEISARAAIVVEYPSGRVLYSRAMHDQLAPASTTKILTAILALEYGKLDEVFTTTDEDLVGESSMGLASGERQTLLDLLYGMMLPSGNDASMVVARGLAEKAAPPETSSEDPIARFSAMMNKRVEQLGLRNSHFANPHGLDMEGHYSSAYDLASLSWYAMHFPTFNEVVKQISYDAPGHPLLNTNEMLTRYEGADGIKTGWTDAGGLCLVTSATRGERRLISVVLNSPRWYADSGALLDFGFAKLAQVPTDAGAEVLEVTRRGVADWILGEGSTPSMLPPQMAGGGGVVAHPGEAEQAQPLVAAPAPVQEEAAPLQSIAGANSPTTGSNNVPWALLLSGLVGVVIFYAVATRLAAFRPRRFFATVAAHLPQRAQVTYAPAPTPIRAPQRRQVEQAGTPGRPTPAHRTLGTEPNLRRREPNLLVSPEQLYRQHLARAVDLAWEGRQGSSMAEFLLALRMSGSLDVAEIVAVHQLGPDAFLALSRAQVAAGQLEDAHRTLTHGILVLPQERFLRMAIKQLESDYCA